MGFWDFRYFNFYGQKEVEMFSELTDNDVAYYSLQIWRTNISDGVIPKKIFNIFLALYRLVLHKVMTFNMWCNKFYNQRNGKKFLLTALDPRAACCNYRRTSLAWAIPLHNDRDCSLLSIELLSPHFSTIKGFPII